jgi:hypothetical protein
LVADLAPAVSTFLAGALLALLALVVLMVPRGHTHRE